MSAVDQQFVDVYVGVCVATYHHVERVERLEAGDHGRYKRVSCDFGKHIALVPDVLDLLEADH
jgi:hypothetical protein